ncbi:MAG: Na(+)-translocating NADH-quinone reductase subunit C [Myxococcota bacterium]|nr:Na(+)-translocating NADH-quinone reductase subunit C [Myxococcota bacterium]
MQHSTGYTLLFAAGVCLVCSIFVSGSAVGLKDRQEANALLDKQKKVLSVAGLMKADADWPPEQITQTFTDKIVPKVVELKTGSYAADIDPLKYDQQKAMLDEALSEVAPDNRAKVLRVPKYGLVYQFVESGKMEKLILPVEGKGLWSTLYGYVALSADTQTIDGLTFYKHGETPGLGGEVDNPKWKALWQGRKPFDSNFEPVIEVIKGQAGPVSAAPSKIDGLSGATITGNGVTHLMRFWLGEHGFGEYLARVRQGGA